MIQLATRMARLGTESAFEVLARARALEARGKQIVHLEFGEPDAATAPHVVEAGCRALQQGATHYTPAPGIPELRAAVAEQTSARRGHPISPEQVVITPGAKPIMFYTLLALAEEGDEVIYPNPGFPIYESMIRYVGARPVPLPLLEERGFRFDADQFRALASERTRLVILNSPQNPTGGVLTREDLEAIAAVCVARDIPVLSDEVYEAMAYETPFTSIASLPGMSTQERTILLHGFSKTYAMTGWRLGYGVMPAPLAEQFTKLMVNSNSCTAAATQWAGLAALTGPQDSVQTMLGDLRRRRDLMVNGLNEIPGFRCVTPQGAFYAFPNIRDTGMDSRTCAQFLLEEAGVACLAGSAFGEYGEGYLRFSYTNSDANILEALERMRAALGRRLG